MLSPRPAERALGCFGSALAVPTMLPMTALVEAMVRNRRLSVAVPLLVVLAILASLLFLPYAILLHLLGRLGLVRLKQPARWSVTGESPGSCSLSLTVPEDERETAARMLHDLAGRLAAVAGGEPENLHGEIRRVTAIDYATSTELRLRFSDDVTLEGQVYADYGNLNADLVATYPPGQAPLARSLPGIDHGSGNETP